MKIEILCSTMFGKVPLFYEKGFRNFKSVVVNQISSEKQEVESYINTLDKGLSKSRNKAIANASADICVITDNDVYFKEDFLKIIEKSFNSHPEADILTFQIETPEGEKFKKYESDFFWHTKKSIAKVSSVEMAFRRKSIIEKGITFDDKFGLGSIFPTGEEYIFLSDAVRSGLKVGYIPKVIAYHPKESSGGDFKNLSLIQAKGAMINRVFGFGGVFICLIFSLKKYKSSKIGFIQFLKNMMIGYLKGREL